MRGCAGREIRFPGVLFFSFFLDLLSFLLLLISSNSDQNFEYHLLRSFSILSVGTLLFLYWFPENVCQRRRPGIRLRRPLKDCATPFTTASVKRRPASTSSIAVWVERGGVKTSTEMTVYEQHDYIPCSLLPLTNPPFQSIALTP